MSGFVGYIDLDSSQRATQKQIHKIESELFLRGSEIKRIIGKNQNFAIINTSHNSSKNNFSELENIYNRYIVSIEGCIHNIEELFDITAKKIGENSISELIVSLYLLYGKNFPIEIQGEFSIIIFDTFTKSVQCIRDHLGVRPFFFKVENKRLLFGSEIPLIKILSKSNFSLNERKLFESLKREEIHHDQTFIENVFKIRRGHFLDFKKDGIKQTQYHVFKKGNNDSQEKDFSTKFFSVFEKSVRQRICYEENIGTALSGGLDSSSVTKMLCHLNTKYNLNKNIFSYSYYFPDVADVDKPKIDEMRYANEVARDGGFISRVVKIKKYDVVNELLESQKYFSEPCTHTNRYQELAVIKSCKNDSVNTLLTGFDGDTTVGYGQELVQKYLQNHQILKGLNAYSEAQKKANKKNNVFKTFLRYYVSYYLPWQAHYIIKKIRGFENYSPHFKFLKDETINSIDFASRVKADRKLMFDYGKAHENILNTNNFPKVFEMLDVDYIKNGIYEKHPFCDVRLMELSLSFPLEQKMKNGLTRYILRNAMKNHLPQSVLNRTNKSNLSFYFIYSVDKNIDKLFQTIIDSNLILKDMINIKKVKKMYFNKDKMTLDDKAFLCYLNIIHKWIEHI